MYNNEVTYNQEWNTPSNMKALEKLQKFLFRTRCMSDCPVSWAPEVLELLTLLDNKYGIERHTGNFKYNMLDILFVLPAKSFWYSFKSRIIDGPPKWREEYSLYEKMIDPVSSLISGIRQIPYLIKQQYVNALLNAILKPKIRLDQVKEKYGTLRVYHSAPEDISEYVDFLIRRCEVKLAIKGAYYKLEDMYNWKSSRYSDTELYELELTTTGDQRVTKTEYRQIMKDLNVNLDNVKLKALEKEALDATNN